MGRERACSSPSNVTVAVLKRRHRRNEPQDGAREAAVDAGPRSRVDRTADGQLGVDAVDRDAEGLHGADHQVGVAAAQRAADGRRAVPRGQRGQHQRAVGQ